MYEYTELCWLDEKPLGSIIDPDDPDAFEYPYHIVVVKFKIKDTEFQSQIGYERIGDRVLKFYTQDHEMIIRTLRGGQNNYAMLDEAYAAEWVDDKEEFLWEA